MKPRAKNGNGSKPSVVRCAVYTRKSTEEGLNQEFNSLDAQREACEAYIASQKHEGWALLAECYDDPGYSGATADRPALKRLLRDVEAGRIDTVTVYRLDRVSRFLPDFARINEIFEKHMCALVSVTEAFSTATPAGRLHLNMLMSFSQHEREVIAERTRHKMAAARRRGRWIGGIPILGYDIHPDGGKLLANKTEAKRVRQIFELYLEKESLLDTCRELNRRGWTTKAWTTREGVARTGKPWTKTALSTLLTNWTFAGKIQFEGVVYEGEQEGIVDPEVFDRVQLLLKRNNRCKGQATRNKHNALLRGLLQCAACGTAMSHVYTMRGTRRYRYYSCTTAQKRGRDACPTRPLPAGEIEAFVVERIRTIGTDRHLQTDILKQAGKEVDRADLEAKLAEFTPVWDALIPKERARVIELIVERIAFDAAREVIAVTFRPAGIAALTAEVAS